MDKSREALITFYRKCLTVNADTHVTEALDQILAEDFVSHGSSDSKTKAQLIQQIAHFWKLIPDLKWEPQEMVKDGDKFVVRSLASGTPKGDFMGLHTDGSKSFKIMTMDLHTLVEGQLSSVYHLEDWGTALKQLAV